MKQSSFSHGIEQEIQIVVPDTGKLVIYPSINENVNTNMPTFWWKSNNALGCIIKIDNEEYKT